MINDANRIQLSFFLCIYVHIALQPLDFSFIHLMNVLFRCVLCCVLQVFTKVGVGEELLLPLL